MTTRDEHLRYCKDRALEVLGTGDLKGAVGSMTSDLLKWDGGAMYDATTIAFLSMDGVMFCNTEAQVRHWIEGFA